MAEYTDVKYELCVNWTTELPTKRTDRGSCNITIEQYSDWFLELCFDRGWYNLFIYNEEKKHLKKPITVTTTIKLNCDSDEPFLSCDATVRGSGDRLWCMSKRDLASSVDDLFDIGQINIICVFHDCLESKKESVKTQISRPVTATVSRTHESLTTQTDFASTSCSTASRDLQTLSSDFSSFMKDETFSDVELKCGDRTFSAHKSVLAARSEVFAAMFRNKIAESETGVLDVQDLDPDVLEQLLKYVYSGEKPDLCLVTACRLFGSADKYAVYELKKTCSEFLMAELTLENCLDLLVIAGEHTEEDLKEGVSRFVAENLHLVTRETWSTFRKEHLELAVEVYDKRFTAADAAFIDKKTHVSTQTNFASLSCPTVLRNLQDLSSDFSSFVEDEAFSDVKLKCGDSTFSAHKSVLAARSEVFAAMFRNKMAESETGLVDVQDLDPDVFESLLKYVYSGEKPDLCQDIARRLYEAADRYAVYALKKTCSEYMAEDMTPENCLDLLVLGDEHSDEDFKETVSRFVAEHLQSFSKEKWSSFKKEHPELAVEVYDKRFADAVDLQ